MLPSFQFILANSLPPLPEGPSLENVRGPLEASGGYGAWSITLVVLAVLLMAGLIAWRYHRSQRQTAAPLDPLTAALSELEAASQAADDGRFVQLCAGALRRLLTARCGLPASTLTTVELCARLPLGKADTRRMSGLLERCDAVKFAGQALTPEQRIELLDTARELIQQLAASLEGSAT